MSRVPKTLLLTDVPPCDRFPAGLALSQFCRIMPPGSLAVYSVVNPDIDARLSPEFDSLPSATRRKPPERIRRVLPGFPGGVVAAVQSAWRLGPAASAIVSDVVRFGREVGAEGLWCILEGQTMIRLARPVSKALRLPLRSWAWDAPGWWLRDNGVDRLTTALAVREFGEALRGSVSFGAASRAMADLYSQRYGVHAVPVIPGLDGRLARPASGAFRSDGRLVIGMAGQLYASQEWDALMRALDAAGWILSGREVTVRLMGARASLSAPGYRRIEYLGWGSQAGTVAAMAEADILYCPYWLSPEYEEEARVGFPSKLTTYLAAGRPVLFHGPAYASPARFLEENGAALRCDSNDPRAVLSALERLAGDAALRGEIAERGGRAFADHLTLGKSRERFAEFLGVSPDDLERPAGT